MTPAAIYLRTTSEESQSEFQLVTELEQCRAHAAERGYRIIGEYNDIRSGGQLDDRPALLLLRRSLGDHGGGVVIIARPDALAATSTLQEAIVALFEQDGIRVEQAPALVARTA